MSIANDKKKDFLLGDTMKLEIDINYAWRTFRSTKDPESHRSIHNCIVRLTNRIIQFILIVMRLIGILMKGKCSSKNNIVEA